MARRASSARASPHELPSASNRGARALRELKKNPDGPAA